MTILYDRRWIGEHGIGRFAREVRLRLPCDTTDLSGNDPSSLRGLIELEIQCMTARRSREQLFFSPGYAPPITWNGPLAFTIHDLIHLQVREEQTRFKTAYYRSVVRPAARRAARVLTVSEYSKAEIVRWAGISPEQVVVVGNGVSLEFKPDGPAYQPGFPYVLYVGNRKPHKNMPRLLAAFAQVAQQVPEVRLVLSGAPDNDTRHLALKLGMDDRLVFAGQIVEAELPALYRGASVVTLPSLYEGFGLPPLEAMACGTPVVVSSTTSLPEVVGEAAVLVNPTDIGSIVDGLTRALTDSGLRDGLRQAGLIRTRAFTWERVVDRVKQALAEVGTS